MTKQAIIAHIKKRYERWDSLASRIDYKTGLEIHIVRNELEDILESIGEL